MTELAASPVLTARQLHFISQAEKLMTTSIYVVADTLKPDGRADVATFAVAREICERLGIDPDTPVAELRERLTPANTAIDRALGSSPVRCDACVGTGLINTDPQVTL